MNRKTYKAPRPSNRGGLLRARAAGDNLLSKSSLGAVAMRRLPRCNLRLWTIAEAGCKEIIVEVFLEAEEGVDVQPKTMDKREASPHSW